MPKITSVIRQTDLRQGMNIHHNKFLVSDNNAVYLKNCNTDLFGGWRRRNGYSKVGDTMESGSKVTGLHSQVLNNGTKRLLASVNDSSDATVSVLKYLNGSTWTEISGTAMVEDAKTTFTNWLNQVFITGYDSTDGTYNTIKELSDTTIGTTNLTSAPNAKYAVEYLDQLYLGNIQISGTQYPSYLAYSSVPTIAGAITWDPTITGMIGIGISDGDEITGMSVAYGQLLIYKNSSVYIYNGNSLYKASTYGTSSYSSIKSVGQNVLALHWGADRKAITMYDGQGVRIVSDTIEPIMNGITSTNAKNATAGVKEGHYYVFVGDVTIDEEHAEYFKIPTTITNCLIDLDIVHSTSENPIIAIHSLPISITCMEEHDGEFYFGSTNGEVYKWDDGNSDNTTPIEMDLRTKLYYGTDPDLLKDFYKVIIYMNKRVPAKAMYSIDNAGKWSEWQTLGDLNSEFNVFTRFLGTGHGIRIRVVANGTEGSLVFDGFSAEFIVKDVSK